MEAGIIPRSKSPYSFPFIVIVKKDGTYRICIDYRKLNVVTRIEIFPIGNIGDILDRLSKSKIFTVIYLKAGY
jgi:hypothetical protein